MTELQFNTEYRSPFDKRFEIAIGTTLPNLDVQLLDGHIGYDLTTGTVTFSMESEAGVVKINAAAGILQDGPVGIVRYAWSAADTDTAGIYYGQFTVTVGSDTIKIPNNDSQKLIIKVYDKVN